MTDHRPQVKMCPKGLFEVRCTCIWFVNAKFVDPASAIDFWASQHGRHLVDRGEDDA